MEPQAGEQDCSGLLSQPSEVNKSVYSGNGVGRSVQVGAHEVIGTDIVPVLLLLCSLPLSQSAAAAPLLLLLQHANCLSMCITTTMRLLFIVPRNCLH